MPRGERPLAETFELFFFKVQIQYNATSMALKKERKKASQLQQYIRARFAPLHDPITKIKNTDLFVARFLVETNNFIFFPLVFFFPLSSFSYSLLASYVFSFFYRKIKRVLHVFGVVAETKKRDFLYMFLVVFFFQERIKGR